MQEALSVFSMPNCVCSCVSLMNSVASTKEGMTP